MTLVTGTVQDLGHAPMDGTLYARPARFLPAGNVVYAPERTPYKIEGGTFSVELAPGPAVLELKVGTHARDEFRVVIPDQETIGLADLITEVFPWQPEQVSKFVAERELAVQAKKDAETAAGQASTAAGTATTAAQQTGQDRSHVDQVRALLDETYDESQAGMALPPRLTETALSATYGPSVTMQPDYVSQIERLLAPRTLAVKKTGTGNGLDIISASESGESTRWGLWTQTTGGQTDNYQYLGPVYATTGRLETSQGVRSRVASTGTAKSGSWVTGQAIQYTTAVGATMEWSTTTVVGDTIYMGLYGDDRGGQLTVEIVGTSTSTTVSTWRAVGQRGTVELFTSPVSGTVTIRATFTGADPAHAPTGGTARGWAHDPAHANSPDQFRVEGVMLQPAPETLLSKASNRDVAINVAPVGGSAQFIPYHGVDTEERIDDPIFLLDGTEIDVEAASVGTEWAGSTLDVIQHFYGLNHTVTPDQRVVEVWSRQRVHSSGKASIQVRLTALVDLTTTWSVFGLMLPAEGTIFDEIIASDGRSWPHTLGSTTAYQDQVPDGDRIQSWAAVSSARPDLVAAMTANGLRDTLRAGGDRKPSSSGVRIDHRSDGLVKVYPGLFESDEVIAAGESIHISGEVLYAASPSIGALLSRAS
ncbi:hypothetical protein [Dietzia sp. MNB45]|uniref:hypothetical protein n=1 Tax=Dietzia sp. MNB45 TaxID=3238800 RepID=UPI003F7E80CE